MSAQQSSTAVTLAQRRALVLETATKIDETAAAAMVHFKGAGSMAAELQVAQAMADLRAMLTPDVMLPIMAVMNTDLGFRTDRDPKQVNTKTGAPYVPYPVEVVRDVLIESKLRGFHTIGNEFNIISGRFYAAKSGFRRKLTDGKSFPGLTGFRDSYDVPRLQGDKGAIIKCRAEWKLDGKADKMEFEFAIRVNAGMGADAIQGKAERKLCKRVHDLLSGVNTPDAEVGEDPAMGATNVTHTAPPPPPPAAAPRPVDDDDIPFPATHINQGANADDGTATTAATDPAVSGEPADPRGDGGDPAPVAGPEAGDPEPEPETPQQRLAGVVLRAGFTFDQFIRCEIVNAWFDGKQGRPQLANVMSFDDVPASIALKLLAKNEAGGVIAGIKREIALGA